VRRQPFAHFHKPALTAYDALCLLVTRSLANNQLCLGFVYGNYTAESINALCDALKSTSTLTSLKYASQLESFPHR